MFDFGPIQLHGNPARDEQGGVAYCPRRIALDTLLVDGARESGAEVREGFTFQELVCDEALSGDRPLPNAMAAYQDQRDLRVGGMYEFTTSLAALEPPPLDLQRLLAAIAGDPAAMDEFASVVAGTMPPEELFAPDHVHALLANPLDR